MGPTQLGNTIVVQVLWIVALIVLATPYWRRLGPRLGSSIAVAALSTVVFYLVVLAVAHSIALRQAQTVGADLASWNNEQVVKVAAMPTVANPTEWICAMETNRASYRFSVSLLQADSVPSNVTRFEKPAGLEAEAVSEAERDYRAQVFLGFARFPAMSVVGEDCATQTLVQFADIRYTEPGRGRGTFSLDVPVDCPVEHNTAR